MAKKISGGEYIAHALKLEGVEVVFGIIDGTYNGLIAGLKNNGIRLITPRHETSAAHMAAAYARMTGRTGVCIASNGPGVANILPGIAVENAEGNRLLVITSSRRSGIGYPDRGGTYQYFNQTGVIRQMSKWSETAHFAGRIPELTRKAFRESYNGRPGVVHLDVPENLINSKDEYPGYQLPQQYRRQHRSHPPVEMVNEVAQRLVAAKIPAIHAGSGIIHAQAFEELEEIAELLQAPVVTSWAARGVFKETSELTVPMIFVPVVNTVRTESDLMLILGSRVSETDWWGKPPYWGSPSEQTTIQVDIDDSVLGNNRPADLLIQADLKVFLSELLLELQRLAPEIRKGPRNKFIDKIARERKAGVKKFSKHLKDKKSPLNPAHIAATCRRLFADDAITVFDGGNTAIWGNFFHEVREPNTQLSTYKFGMLGAGIAQALGAQAAHPERQVYCITGDGAMGFHPQEIETAVRNNLPVIYLVVCDKQWGMVKLTQQMALKPVKTIIKKKLSDKEVINTDLGEIEFDRLAESMGAHGERVSDPDSLQAAIERSIESGRCSVIHIDVNPVKHMWAPGLMYFKDMHKEPKG